ncbi:MAG: HPr kinase/phosphorylase [Pseudaminobacter sp.]|nr:HPr kinase/phosphorylase [Pseudaminobacter sp.]
MARANIHATAVVLRDRCVLIAGPSGSGKSTLGLALVAHFQALGWFARLVGDDQVFLDRHGAHVVCRAPSTIGGLVEIRGVGPRPVEYEPRAVVDLLVRLTSSGDPERFPEETTEQLVGRGVPVLTLAGRNVAGAIPAVSARLFPLSLANAGGDGPTLRQNG